MSVERADCAPAEPLARLRAAIDAAAHYLPAQGPITVFIHHNTLHAFEHLPFDEGVQQGASMLGCEPYLAEGRYRSMLATGRIQPADLDAVLLESLGDQADELIGFSGTRFHLRQSMLRFGIQSARAFELDWFIAETDALQRFRTDVPDAMRRRFLDATRQWVLRDHRQSSGEQGTGRASRLHATIDTLLDRFGRKSIDRWSEGTWERFSLTALWNICQQGVGRLLTPRPAATPAARLRDTLLAATGRDADALVNDLLIRLCSAFLDQGMARWSIPDRAAGLLQAFSTLVCHEPLAEHWIARLPEELDRITTSDQSTLALIEHELHLLGVGEQGRQVFLTATLLALRGWAGMIQQIEARGDRVKQPIPAGTLDAFLLIRLVLDRLAAVHVARIELDFHGDLRDLPGFVATHPACQTNLPSGVNARAFQVFQLAQVTGWLPPALAQLTGREWAELVREIEAFPPLLRRQLFQAAFERRYRIATLDAIAVQAGQPRETPTNPRFQMICCLDEREESFRRHFEERVPDAETLGVAGFYSTPMYYRGAGTARFVPLCPIAIRPQHWVVESADDEHWELDDQRERARKAWGRVARDVQLGTQGFASGAVLSAGLGALATIPLVVRVMFPRLTARLRKAASRLIRPPAGTHLQLHRQIDPAAAEEGHYGFSLDEMIAMSEQLLRDIGLTARFAPLVLLVGHGSQSLNNPHNSAYNCGACGGSSGGPNARAMAEMLNDPRVRSGLARRGIVIPDGTWFLGAAHNTCSETVDYFDTDRIPVPLVAAFQELSTRVADTCERNAHERCRRFLSAPLTLTPEQALRHVEARAEDLAQTRPECGHASNAVCFIGRRSRTRGLFMDRRTFLTSYDPTLDDSASTVLTRLLGAAVPVCAGINLEYYFSYVDNVGFGCGSKLPHNVTSLLGVMDGAASDLRTGLPWQMVEIHEPMRLLLIVETKPATMSRIMDERPELGRLLRNGWLQLATLDPDSSEIHVLRGDRLERYIPETTTLPSAGASIDWYRGCRDNLGYAAIDSSGTPWRTSP